MAAEHKRARVSSLLRKLATKSKDDKVKLEAIKMIIRLEGLDKKPTEPATPSEPEPDTSSLNDLLAKLPAQTETPAS